MYKVFFYSHTIYIGKPDISNIEYDELWDFTTVKAMKKFLFDNLKENYPQVVFISASDPFHVWTRLCKLFQIREAAGGLVINAKNEWLFIRRRGKWDLPKGHLEKGELHKKAALREVQEECSIKGLTIEKTLCITYHTYDLKSSPILKPTYWYLMTYTGNKSGKPQLEEDIEEVRWVSTEQALKLIDDGFPSIGDVFRAAIQ